MQQCLKKKSEVVRKNWHILQINPDFCNAYVNKPTLVFKRNRNIQDIIGGHLRKDEKVAKKKSSKVKTRHVIKQDQAYVVCKSLSTSIFKSN